VIERIKALFPFIFILVAIGALINVGAIPGREPILRFLGLGKNTLSEEVRPLSYVPGRLHELQPSPYQMEELPGPSSATFPSTSSPSSDSRFSPTPVVFPTPTVAPVYDPNQPPPPPPPHVLGSKINATDFASQDEGVWETVKNYFSGIF